MRSSIIVAVVAASLLSLASALVSTAWRRPLVAARAARAPLRALLLPEQASLLVSAALDYSAEIENAVGTEVYTPIFKAGLGLFASGILTAFAAAFIIRKADSFGDLAEEFERGKQTQLIASDMPTEISAAAGAAPAAPEAASTAAAALQAQQAQSTPVSASSSKDLKGLDL